MRIQTAAPLLLLLAAACGGEPVAPNTTPPSTGTASIGPQGGAVTAELGGGARVTLTVPSGALASPVSITITPGTAAGAGERARFSVAPADVTFDRPAVLELTLPGGSAPRAAEAFVLLTPAAVPLPTEIDAGSRVLRARLSGFVLGGLQPPAVNFRSGADPGAPPAAARAADGSAELVVLPADLAGRLQAARDAIALMASGSTLDQQLLGADRAELAMRAAFQLASPQGDATVRQVAIDWGNALCARYDAAVTVFRATVSETISQFKANAAPMFEWAARREAFVDAFAPGAPPAEACAAGVPDLGGALSQQGATTLAFIDAELSRIDATTRAGAAELVAKAKDGIQIGTWFAQAGLPALQSDAFATVGRNVARVREPAFGQCRADGDWSQYRQLFGFAQTIQGLPGISTADLGADVHFCGTPLLVRIEDADNAPLVEAAVAGGASPGAQVTQLTRSVASRARRLLLQGSARAIRCPINGAVANEQLVITTGSTELARLAPGGGTYPSPLLTRTIAELRTAAGVPSEGAATITLVVRRTGTGCPVDDQLFDYPPTLELARLTLDLQPTLRVTTTSLPDAVAGRAYSVTLQAEGGGSQRAWTVTGGTLPAGLALATNGTLAGTPTTAGTSTFDVRVTSDGDADERALTLRVVPPLTASAPAGSGVLGQPFSLAIQASGGTGSYGFVVTGGALPAGLTLNPATGVISGTPTATGTSTVTITVTSGTQTVTVTVTISVTASPQPPPPPPSTDPWEGRWVGTITNRRFVPPAVSEYAWELQFDSEAFVNLGTVQYVSFPGTDFQCTVLPANNDRNSTAFTGSCGRPGVNFFTVRGTRSSTRIDAIGDDPITTFVDDFLIVLNRQ